MTLRAVDLFCGAGGLSLGLAQAGIPILAAYDSSEPAVATYRRNLGPHGHVADVSSLDASTVMRDADTPDRDSLLIVGGPPCQGFSLQRRGPIGDIRNDMIFEFLRLVTEIRPGFFMMENVAALNGPRGKPYLTSFLATARSAGYVVQVAVLNAADYGVPQVRRRTFVVGERGDRSPRFQFPPATHTAASWTTVRQAIGDLPSPGSAAPGGTRLANHVAPRISELNVLRISHVPEGGGREDLPEHLRLACHTVSVETAGHRAVYGRLTWDKPSATITTRCNSFTRGRFAHPSEDRNITMREAARLQGFPDSFVLPAGTVQAAHQIGNAVPPPLARELGDALLQSLERDHLPEGAERQLALPLGA